MTAILLPSRRRGIRQKLLEMHWGLVAMLTLLAFVGVATLYSVADGSWSPWAARHAIRFGVGVSMLIVIGLVPIRVWMELAYPAYFIALAFLALVPIIGEVNMGARRWIEVGGLQFQPSEMMKLALVMGLARYYQGLRVDQVSHPLFLIPPLIMIGAPAFLVFQEPDLGTAILIAATGITMVFLAGLSWRYILPCLVAIGLVLVAGQYVVGSCQKVDGSLETATFTTPGTQLCGKALQVVPLKPYQVSRILTFLDPERDPLGKGYHLLQSKIALGSGGVTGKGYMQGTQSQLDFLPEKQTDFIFTIFGEEFGLVGASALLALYAMVFLTGVTIASRAKSHFGRLVSMGLCVTFILYALINTAMVMGLAPVVGVPLPLVSYGGTVMTTLMVGFGLVMSVHVHRDQDTMKTGDLL